MEKDFDGWNEHKKQTNDRDDAPFYHARELWWCTVGINVGSEQDGSDKDYRRPILILKAFRPATCLAIPLTTSPRQHPQHPSLGAVNGKTAHALRSQLRVVDTKRLVRKIGYLDEAVLEEIRKAAKAML